MLGEGRDGDGPGDRGSGAPITTRIVSTDDVSLAVHDFGGDGSPLLLCHPTGFHGMIWAPVAAELTKTHHVWAVDFRGHGDSSLPASSLDWGGMGDDVRAVVEHIGEGAQMVGAGLSMGGAALLLAEANRPGTFASLWLFEPIVVPRIDRSQLPGNPMADAARRRRAVFPDREAARANYAAKPPLATVNPAALEAYVQHGLRDLPDGTVGLKCSPETEAEIFDEGTNNGVFDRLGEVKCPVTVAASGDGGFPAQMATTVASNLPDGHLEHFDDLTHFGPMESPHTIAQAIHAALT